jgi:hypothetical protein
VAIELTDKHKLRAIYIEGRASGGPLIQTLRKFLRITIKELTPAQDKVLRANSVAPLAENGIVSIYENIKDLPDRLSDLCSFPYIRNDDFVDAFVYGILVARDELGVRIESFIQANPNEVRPINLFDAALDREQFKVIGIKDKEIKTKTRITTIPTGNPRPRAGGRMIFR